MIKGKKGYAYFVEIILAIIIVFVVLQGFVESQQDVYSYKQQADMRELSWSVIRNLDEINALDPLMNKKDFATMEIYVRESLDDFTQFDLEYYNRSCYSVNDGTLSDAKTVCDKINFTGEQNVVSTYYTYPGNTSAQSVKIYLWRRLS